MCHHYYSVNTTHSLAYIISYIYDTRPRYELLLVKSYRFNCRKLLTLSYKSNIIFWLQLFNETFIVDLICLLTAEYFSPIFICIYLYYNRIRIWIRIVFGMTTQISDECEKNNGERLAN